MLATEPSSSTATPITTHSLLLSLPPGVACMTMRSPCAWMLSRNSLVSCSISLVRFRRTTKEMGALASTRTSSTWSGKLATTSLRTRTSLFVLGFGTAMCSAPQYMAEIAPVHIRGRLVGVFGACFQIGSIFMGCAMIGFTKSIDQVGINLGLTGIYFVFTAVGAWIIDRFRRRTLIFAGLITFILCQTAVTITSWQYSLHPSEAAAALTVMLVFMYQVFSASLIATMHNLYPVEILSLPLRAKGMGLYSMFQGAAGVVQTYGISVGIAEVGYKIWVVYVAYNLIQLVVAYFVFPETSELSLEEIDAVFETPGVNPVKMSWKIQEAKRERERAEREGAVSEA